MWRSLHPPPPAPPAPRAGDLCRKHNVLLLVDTVCSLGGVPLYADAWKVGRGGRGWWGCTGRGLTPLLSAQAASTTLPATPLNAYTAGTAHRPQIDAIYSGSQKCLSAPPGAAPLMLNDRALEKVRSRKTTVRRRRGGGGQGAAAGRRRRAQGACCPFGSGAGVQLLRACRRRPARRSPCRGSTLRPG